MVSATTAVQIVRKVKNADNADEKIKVMVDDAIADAKAKGKKKATAASILKKKSHLEILKETLEFMKDGTTVGDPNPDKVAALEDIIEGLENKETAAHIALSLGK